MKIIVKNAKITNHDSQYSADILIKNEIIEKIAPNITEKADKIIDAEGKHVLPGAIDTHVHFALPTFAGLTADDFVSGSRAAINGGTTTVIDFVTPHKGQSLIEAFLERKKEAQSAFTNTFLHVSPVEWTETTAAEMETLVKKYGVTSFKIYMAYKKSIGIDDQTLIKVLETAKKLNALVIAHCEHDEIIEHLRDKFVLQGKTAPKYHPLSRPAQAEAEAVYRLYLLAKEIQTPVYAVHVSTAKALEIIETARKDNVTFYAETCPQYMFLNDSVYNAEFDKAAKFVMSPPLRKESDQQALVEAIEQLSIDTIGTDHCSFTLEQKRLGKNDFRKIPNGAAGVENRMELLLTKLHLERNIPLQHIVKTTAFNPAKIFKINKRGQIKEGFYADLVIWDFNTPKTISAKTHTMKADNNIYEGFKVSTTAQTVIVNGKILKENNKLLI